MIKKLTPKQARFIDEFLITLNATESARRAGYAPRRADQIAYENLRKPEIQEALRALMAARSERTEISQDRVLHELAGLAFVIIGADDVAAKSRLSAKVRSLELLGRHLGLFTETPFSGTMEVVHINAPDAD
ncbi:MAG: terminase small subunit [Thiobacillaceae bacterium]